MDLEEQIKQIWKDSNFIIPKVFIIYYEKQYMAVINDSTDFIRFIRSSSEVYLAINKYCQLEFDKNIGMDIYVCKKAVPILCSPFPGKAGILDNFVLGTITPMLQTL